MKTVRSETILVTKILFIDLTKKRVGGILKKEEVPDSVGRLHYVLLKAVQSFETLGGFTLYLFYRKRVSHKSY